MKKPPIKKSGRTGAVYAAVVEVMSPDAVAAASGLDEEEKEGKNQGNFLERMRKRDRREVKRGILQGGEPSPRVKTYRPASMSRHRRKLPVAAAAEPNPIEELKCSKDMKDFMMSEFAREKEIYKDVPENQVANSIIHGFKTHQANSGKLEDNLSPLSQVQCSTKKRSSTRKKPLSSVEIETDQDSDEDEEISIQEFDESELQMPAEGSFSLSPSPRQLRSRRSLLVRFTKDRESNTITNLPGQVLIQKYNLGEEDLPAEEKKADKTGRKSKKKSPKRVKRAVVKVEPRETPAKRSLMRSNQLQRWKPAQAPRPSCPARVTSRPRRRSPSTPSQSSSPAQSRLTSSVQSGRTSNPSQS